MRARLMILWLIPLSCSTPARPAGELGSELAGLTRMVQDLETAVDARATSAAQLTMPSAVRSHDLPSRFAMAPAGSITVTEAERPALSLVARDLGSLDPASAVDIVLDYAKTPSGLARVAKVLALMKTTARSAILKHLRPIEIRVLLELRVVHRPPADGLAAQATAPIDAMAERTDGSLDQLSGRDGAGTSAGAKTPDVGSTPPTKAGSAKDASTAATVPAKAFARYQIAGFGQDAWKTLLDTVSGVVYNYRDVSGVATWVPITIELAPKQIP